VREIILIAQDTTDYGHDLGMKDGLAQLLEQLVQAAPGIDWFRIMYAYPGYVTDQLIEVMAEHKQILPYLDMPLQHAHPMVLRRMRRPANVDWVYRTLEKMQPCPTWLCARRLSLVTREKRSRSSKPCWIFLRELRFDRVGAFKFSFEPGTASEGWATRCPPK
jgi:ribosomal protein S12 methylthiotransferase